MITCVRRVHFSAGHRVMGHENKCAQLHGHNYIAFIHATAPELDQVGRIIDFGVLKERVGGWIDRNWDHGFIVNEKDEAGIAALKLFAGEPGMHQKMYYMDRNPTAENLAMHLLETVCPEVLEGTDIEVVRVVVWETENCYAEASR